MSYILEALRKSEQERQRGAAPDLRSASVSMPMQRKTPRWSLALLALLLLAGGMAIGILRPWQHEPVRAAAVDGSQVGVAPPTAAATTTSIATVTANSAHTNPTPTVETRGPLPTAAPPQAMAPAPAVSAPAPVVSAPPPAVSAPAPAIAAPATGKTVAARPAATAPPPARPAQPAAIDVPPVLPKVAQAPMEKTVAPPPAPPISPRDAARTLEDQHLPVFAELPPDVQTRLGPLSLSVHFYSPNHERSLVNINGQSLHEGDPLNADLKVDRITPSGVILEYQGRRFQLAAQNWSR